MQPIEGKLNVSHPGVLFKERFINRYSISIDTAARKLHLTPSFLTAFTEAKVCMNSELALKLEVATTVSARFWLERQYLHDLQQVDRLRDTNIDLKVEPLVSDNAAPTGHGS